MTKLEIQITEEDYKKRLDEFLFGKLSKISKTYLRELIKNGKCEVNGEAKNRSYLLRVKDFVELEFESRASLVTEPEAIPLEIIYEDVEILVINKPAGMLVHPTYKVRRGTLLNALAFYLNSQKTSGDHVRAGLVHRLDKDTSGLMLIAKSARAHRILSAHFRRRLVEKKYLALVEGIVEKSERVINAPIGRFDEEKIWNVKSDGKPAETRFQVLKKFSDSTLLKLEPITGRTNQLRIHLAYIGHPIVGDEKYGGRKFPRMCLHAFRLGFNHPNGGELLQFETDTPPEFFQK